MRMFLMVYCSLLALAAGSAAALCQGSPLTEQQKRSIQSAESESRAQLMLNPDSAELLYKLALLERLDGEYAKSLETYTRAARVQKPNAMQLRSVAFNYVELNDFNQATRWLRVAATMEPENVEVLYSLGRALYSQNSFSEAERTFLRVLEIAPDHLRAEENLGLTYEEEHEFARAKVAFSTAVDWAEKRKLADPWPYINLGNLLLLQNETQDALPLFREAVSLAKDSGFSHERLGHALSIVGDQMGSVRELEIAAKLDPQDPKTHFELGHAYRGMGEMEKARAELEKGNALYDAHSGR